MNGISSNTSKGKYDMAENLLAKMMRILEKEKEIQNGNQYFYLATVLIGVILYHHKNYEKAITYFTGTLKRQIEYVGGEKDHPFLEQTYYQMAMMYKQMGNLQTSITMWN